MMQELKRLADPKGILNKGVILNEDPDAHLHSIKKMTLFAGELNYKRPIHVSNVGFVSMFVLLVMLR